MCNAYRTFKEAELFERKFGLALPAGNWEEDVYPGYFAPIIRRPRGAEPGHKEAVVARFGLVPWFAKSDKLSFSTTNARSESAATAASYKGPFKQRQWCIIPASQFYEPFYDVDRWNAGVRKSERYAVARADGEPLGIAGMWERWKPAGSEDSGLVSFTMLTINSDVHPLLRTFHKPFDDAGKPNEKRTVVLLRQSEFDAWLDAGPEQAASFFSTFNADEFIAKPAPPEPRVQKAKAERPRLDEPQPGLF